jgi:hypothetical protein
MRRRPRSPSATPDAPDGPIALTAETPTPHPVRGPRYRFRPASEVILVDDGDDPVVVLELLSPRAAAAALARADELLEDAEKNLVAGGGSDDQGREKSVKGGDASRDADRNDAKNSKASLFLPGSMPARQSASEGSQPMKVDREKDLTLLAMLPGTADEPASSAANCDAKASSGQHFPVDGANDVEMLPKHSMPDAQHLGAVPQTDAGSPDAPSSSIRPTVSSAGESTESDAEPSKPVLHPPERIQDSLELRSRIAMSNGQGVPNDVPSSKHQLASAANLGRQIHADPSEKYIGEGHRPRTPMVHGPGSLPNGKNESHGMLGSLNDATPHPGTDTWKQVGASANTVSNGVDISCEEHPSTRIENNAIAIVAPEKVDETLIASDMDCQTPDVREDDMCTDDELPYVKRQVLRREEARRKEVMLEMVAEREFKIRKEMLESLQVFPPYVDSPSSSSRDSAGFQPAIASQSRVEHILRFRAKHGMAPKVPPIAPIFPILSELAASVKATSDASGISLERPNSFSPNRLAAIRRFRSRYRSRLGKVDSAIPPAGHNFVIWALDARQAPCPCGKGICARGSPPRAAAEDEPGPEPSLAPPAFGSLLHISQDEMVWETC